jgi:hypothetical protein
MAERRIDSVRIQTGDELVAMPWRPSQELRGRLLASGLDSLEDQFASKGTSAPIVVDLADKEPLLEVVVGWLEELESEQAVAPAGLLALMDGLRGGLARSA